MQIEKKEDYYWGHYELSGDQQILITKRTYITTGDP